jgi:hypothetical protein
MANEKLIPTNLNEEETEQFYKVYRILTSDLLELRQFIDAQERQVGIAEKDVSNLSRIIELAQNEDDEEIKEFIVLLQTNIVNSRQYIDNMAGQLENYKEKLIRSEDFINELKADIVMTDKEGECEVGDKLLFLIRYLHSLGHIMEPEEKEKINQKLQ